MGKNVKSKTKKKGATVKVKPKAKAPVKTKAKAVKPAAKKVVTKKPVKIAKPAPLAVKTSKVVVSKKPANTTVVSDFTRLKERNNSLGLDSLNIPKQAATHVPLAFVKEQKAKLLDLRDHILDQMQCVTQDSLRTRPEGSEASAFGLHQADAGSDAYDKDFALSLLSQEQDALYEVEEALKRVEGGTYSICEMSGKPIPRNRLEAIPFARFSIECQTQMEKENKGRRRWETTPQFMDAEDGAEEEEEEGDDERRKEKE